MVTLNPSATVASSKTSHESSLNNVNLLQPNLFRLVVNRGDFPNLEFFAQSITHPSVDAPATEMNYSRVSRIGFLADKLSYGELNAQIILDENMNSYVEMNNWISRMVEEDAQPLSRDMQRISNLPPLIADISVIVLNSHNNKSRNIKYIDCFPVSLGPIDFTSQTTETYITYTVTFKFTSFEIS